MALSVRMMIVPEIDLLDDYFQNSPPEHLEMLGVDPTRLPSSLSDLTPGVQLR